ncbi:hypothetical protein B0I37DRAFT_372900 [Chaetomium sp. MPI-CAGE-AT-0009]|nr:hypothetical protein B0I37DRAFT_372900 [Chaetomium sp. MPI-CAGE-AT-0009]
MASSSQTPPIRSQMTRVVPRQGHVMLTPCKKKFFLHTPRQRPLLLASDKRGLVQTAAFGPLQDRPTTLPTPGPWWSYILPSYLKQRIAAPEYLAAPSGHVPQRRQCLSPRGSFVVMGLCLPPPCPHTRSSQDRRCQDT